jgi:hypothetical protein
MDKPVKKKKKKKKDPVLKLPPKNTPYQDRIPGFTKK